jgi:coproporphyrinogen III oxidase-like Fe-S oxidoreductase
MGGVATPSTQHRCIKVIKCIQVFMMYEISGFLKDKQTNEKEEREIIRKLLYIRMLKLSTNDGVLPKTEFKQIYYIFRLRKKDFWDAIQFFSRKGLITLNRHNLLLREKMPILNEKKDEAFKIAKEDII